MRWRHVIRETRATNRPAVAALIDEERRIKRRMARWFAVRSFLRAALGVAVIAALAVVAWKGSR